MIFEITSMRDSPGGRGPCTGRSSKVKAIFGPGLLEESGDCRGASSAEGAWVARRSLPESYLHRSCCESSGERVSDKELVWARTPKLLNAKLTTAARVVRIRDEAMLFPLERSATDTAKWAMIWARL